MRQEAVGLRVFPFALVPRRTPECELAHFSSVVLWVGKLNAPVHAGRRVEQISSWAVSYDRMLQRPSSTGESSLVHLVYSVDIDG